MVPHEQIDIFTNDLECASDVTYHALEHALRTKAPSLIVYSSPAELADNISTHREDIVFTTIWAGKDSRNRTIFLPAICESYGIRYVGADAYVQALCADKALAKKYCSDYGIASAKGVTLFGEASLGLLNNLDYPVVVKPNFEGSSIGISDNGIVNSYSEAVAMARLLLSKYPVLIAEEYLKGAEVAICIAGTRGNIDMFEVVKLEVDGRDYFDTQLWGFESKKSETSRIDHEIITDLFPRDVIAKARKLYEEFGKVDLMRIDGRLDKSEFSLIELTSDASLHPECFMAFAFQHNGLSYDDMIACLLNQANDLPGG